MGDRLTALGLKALPPGWHCDGRGLYAVIRSTGARSWVFRYRRDGKFHDLGLDTLSDVSLKAARAERDRLRALRHEGTDPLGRVDEFDQGQTRGEGDDGSEVSCSLLASEGDALEALEPIDALLDAGSGFVEGAGEESRLVLFVGFVGDHGGDPALSRGVSVGFAGIALVADDGTGLNIGADVEQGFEVSPVGGFTAGQVKSDDVAGRVGLGMDLCGKATARAAERLSVLPPFEPAADTWARTMVESNI